MRWVTHVVLQCITRLFPEPVQEQILRFAQNDGQVRNQVPEPIGAVSASGRAAHSLLLAQRGVAAPAGRCVYGARCADPHTSRPVIPAKAGIHVDAIGSPSAQYPTTLRKKEPARGSVFSRGFSIPACAGMTRADCFGGLAHEQAAETV
ncbi:MAG TPA: hypothetical protein PK251_11610 [Candidatus Latescibacteria bacterium]|nr:hypothetical protein [Candidatus Latescibacterota bacterium]